VVLTVLYAKPKAGKRTLGLIGVFSMRDADFFFPTATMSAATDKARFFLEKSVPELKEYERKGIFTKASRECAGTQNNS
jgi:hypothetical protein